MPALGIIVDSPQANNAIALFDEDLERIARRSVAYAEERNALKKEIPD